MAGHCIFDNNAVCESAKQEIIRRYYNALCDRRKGNSNDAEVDKLELLMQKTDAVVSRDRKCVEAALRKAEETDAPAVAIQLNDGRIVTGKTSSLLGASSAALLNAIKAVAGIPDCIDVISPEVIEPIQKLKTAYLGNHNPRLHTDEVLIALAVSAATSEHAALALSNLDKLKGCEFHSSVILAQTDVNTLKKLGINITCEPKYQVKKLYHAR